MEAYLWVCNHCALEDENEYWTTHSHIRFSFPSLGDASFLQSQGSGAADVSVHPVYDEQLYGESCCGWYL